MSTQDLLSRRLSHLARRGGSFVHTNPQVGALFRNERSTDILSEGWHHAYGEAHAEVEAYREFCKNRSAYAPMEDIRMYVSLEPCCVHAKTPPCTDLILQNGISSIAYMDIDPNPSMQGKGLALLRSKGVQAESMIASPEPMSHNRHFRVNQERGRPYIILKMAQSHDGFIGRYGERTKISSPWMDRLVHKWRSEANAILVGENTARTDDPLLTNRYYYGSSPTPVVLIDKFDPSLMSLKMCQNTDVVPRMYVRECASPLQNEYITNWDWKTDLGGMLKDLLRHNIGTLLVEGGAKTIKRFIQQGLWDECRLITNTSLQLRDGIRTPAIPLFSQCQRKTIGDHTIELITRSE